MVSPILERKLSGHVTVIESRPQWKLGAGTLKESVIDCGLLVRTVRGVTHPFLESYKDKIFERLQNCGILTNS